MSDVMGVAEAVDRRSSIRAFLPRPVAEATVRRIIDTARRAPSGGNVQPWRVDVVAGDAIEQLKARMVERLASGETEPDVYPIYPDALWEPHRTHRYRVGEEMYGLLGLAREDRAARLRRGHDNYAFFGAPVGLFFSFDSRFGAAQWSDVGMLMQTIMLLAVEEGLGTCAQEIWSRWPLTLSAFLGLPEGRLVFSGMALGYADPDAAVNRLRTDRIATADFATFHGFAPHSPDA